MAEYYDEIFKIILVGDASVGKTNIVSRIIRPLPATTSSQNPSQEQYMKNNIAPTIGVEFTSKMKKLTDGKIIKCQIWDTAGQEQYRAITMAHYRKALGALVVYDITKPKTFENIKRWIHVIREQADSNVVIILVANKCDLRDQQVIMTSEGQKLAQEESVFFSETSAMRGENVEETFSTLVEEINKKKKQSALGSNQDHNQGGFSLIRNTNGGPDERCEC